MPMAAGPLGPAARAGPSPEPGRAPRIDAMSGHSKWSSIKHKKGAADAKRGKLFTQAGPGDHRRRARRRRRPRRQPDAGDRGPEGARRLDAQGQHPAGDRPRHRRGRRRGGDRTDRLRGLRARRRAILVEALTDNRNRTSAEIRHAFDQARRQPRRAGLGRLDLREARRRRGRRRALRRGRPDRRDRRRRRGRARGRRPAARWSATPSDLSAVREALEAAGVEIESAELAMEPKSTVEVDEADGASAAAAARRARRAGRRRRGPRQLRHPRRRAGASSPS